MDASLHNYVGRVQSMRLLSQEQELALARRWSDHGDQAARNLLVQAHLRFVLPIARRYYRPGASMSELVAEGTWGCFTRRASSIRSADIASRRTPSIGFAYTSRSVRSAARRPRLDIPARCAGPSVSWLEQPRWSAREGQRNG